MEDTVPRSPTISRAIAPYVVSDVTTLTLSAAAPCGAGPGGERGAPYSATNKEMNGSMSVRLVFVWSDGPNRLQGELVRGGGASDSCPGVLRPQLDPLALPQRERGDDLAGNHAEQRILDVVVARAGDPALAELVRRSGVPAQPGRAGPGGVLAEGVQLASECPLAVQRPCRRPPGEPDVNAADLGAEAERGVGPVQRSATGLHIGRACELPEVQHVHEVARSAALPEQLGVARAARHLRRDLVRAEATERAVEGDAGAGQAVSAQIGAERERVLGLGQSVQLPAVQLPELLAELPDVEADVSGQARPVGVPLLDAHLPVLEAHEDLRVGIGIERRLEADLELPGIEVVPLDAGLLRVGAHVASGADLGVELWLAPFPAYELAPAGGVRLHLGGVGAGGRGGRRTQRGEGRVLSRRGRGCGGPPPFAQRGEQARERGRDCVAMSIHGCPVQVSGAIPRGKAGAYTVGGRTTCGGRGAAGLLRNGSWEARAVER